MTPKTPTFRLAPWKWITIIWMTTVLVAGFAISIPRIPILEESARNLFLHVPMWFTMMTMFAVGFFFSVKFLMSENLRDDQKASAATMVGIVFGVCGLLTGSLWARFTWGAWWILSEPKMNLAAMSMLLFVAYFLLRTAFDDPKTRARISAIYNVFAVTSVPFLLYVIPRQLPSLHPGAEGNPAFSEITAPELRYIFYPAVIGFILVAMWLFTLTLRVRRVADALDVHSDNAHAHHE